MLESSDYFLSSENPLANVDEREVQGLALRLMQRPEMVEARARCTQRWRMVVEYDAGAAAMATFDEMIEEFCFRSAILGANSDPAYPRIARIFTPPAHWFGMNLPGSRWGGDNVDNCYRIIPLEASGRYELSGRRAAHPPSDVSYSAVADSSTSMTLSTLIGTDVEVGADGRFTITMDGTPTNGRRNHLQLMAGTRFLLIRDSIGDWTHQTPDWLRIRRLDDPGRRAIDEKTMAERAAAYAVDDVYRAYYVLRLFFNGPANTLISPRTSLTMGGMQGQASSGGYTIIAPNEALIITTNDAGARYRSLIYHDYWFRSVDPGRRQTTLNNAQMAADAGGNYTFVVSHADPGVANWIDAAGLEKGLLLFRWQGVPSGGWSASPHIEARLVKLSELTKALPTGVRRVSAAERQAQLATRRAGYDRRYLGA